MGGDSAESSERSKAFTFRLASEVYCSVEYGDITSALRMRITALRYQQVLVRKMEVS
jgi:hypothetical protein